MGRLTVVNFAFMCSLALTCLSGSAAVLTYTVNYSATFEDSVLPVGFPEVPLFTLGGSFTYIDAPPYYSETSFADYNLISQTVLLNGVQVLGTGPTSPNSSALEVKNNHPQGGDAVLTFTTGMFDVGNGLTAYIVFPTFSDPTGTFLSSTNLPLDASIYLGFPLKSLFVGLCMSRSVCSGVSAPIEHVTFTSHELPPVPLIPEPETYALLLTGLGVLGVMAKRRRKDMP